MKNLGLSGKRLILETNLRNHLNKRFSKLIHFWYETKMLLRPFSLLIWQSSASERLHCFQLTLSASGTSSKKIKFGWNSCFGLESLSSTFLWPDQSSSFLPLPSKCATWGRLQIKIFFSFGQGPPPLIQAMPERKHFFLTEVFPTMFQNFKTCSYNDHDKFHNVFIIFFKWRAN